MATERVISDAGTILKEIETLSQVRFLPIIGPVKGKYLAETVKKYKVRKVLEIGTLVGYSAILIAKNMPVGGQVSTIEINPQSAKMAHENIYKAGMDDKIKVHVGNALDVIPEIKEEFDMVFIDAAKNSIWSS